MQRVVMHATEIPPITGRAILSSCVQILTFAARAATRRWIRFRDRLPASPFHSVRFVATANQKPLVNPLLCTRRFGFYDAHQFANHRFLCALS